MYATAADLAARWRPLSSAERDRALVLLDDAEAIVEAEVPDLTARIAAGRLTEQIVTIVVCGIVKRAMLATAEGVTQQSETVGPFAQSLTFANPSGNMFLSKQDRRLLGIGTGRAFTIDTAPVGSGMIAFDPDAADWDAPL